MERRKREKSVLENLNDCLLGDLNVSVGDGREGGLVGLFGERDKYKWEII